METTSLENDFSIKLQIPVLKESEVTLFEETWEASEIEGSIQIRHAGDLLFTIRLEKDDSCSWITSRSPLLVHQKYLVLLQPIDHLTMESNTEFLKAIVWGQVNYLPDGMVSALKVLPIVSKAGEVIPSTYSVHEQDNSFM